MMEEYWSPEIWFSDAQQPMYKAGRAVVDRTRTAEEAAAIYGVDLDKLRRFVVELEEYERWLDTFNSM